MDFSKVVISIFAAIVFSHSAMASSKWSFELKGGQFQSEDSRLSEFYTGKHSTNFALALGFKFLKYFEVGMESSYIQDSGQGYQPLHDQKIGEVIYYRLPLNFYVMLRGRLHTNQIVVPYLAGGWTRLQYIQDIVDQETITGSANGTHFRTGLQLLLDRFDSGKARKFERDYGIENTYLFFEFHSSSVKKESVNVDFSGITYQAGILMEF